MDTDRISVSRFLEANPNPSPSDIEKFVENFLESYIYNYEGRKNRIYSLLFGWSLNNRYKRVWFVRHAESEFNASDKLTNQKVINNPKYFWDANLTNMGMSQAEKILAPDIDLIIVSPLARAIQTALLGFSSQIKSGTPIVADPRICEDLCDSDDLGRTVKELKIVFPRVDFSTMGEEDIWWYHDHLPVNESDKVSYLRKDWMSRRYEEPSESIYRRIDSFMKSITQLPSKYSKIAVVSHSGILRRITGVKMNNSEIVETSVFF